MTYSLYDFRLRTEYETYHGKEQQVDKIDLYYLDEFTSHYLLTIEGVKFTVSDHGFIRVSKLPTINASGLMEKFVLFERSSELSLKLYPMYLHTLTYNRNIYPEFKEFIELDRESRVKLFQQSKYNNDINHNQIDYDMTSMRFLISDILLDPETKQHDRQY